MAQQKPYPITLCERRLSTRCGPPTVPGGPLTVEQPSSGIPPKCQTIAPRCFRVLTPSASTSPPSRRTSSASCGRSAKLRRDLVHAAVWIGLGLSVAAIVGIEMWSRYVPASGSN